METKRLTDKVSVSPQVMPADLQAAYDAGFRSIICNRPDGEAADQPDFAEIAAAAEKLGMTAVYQPIVPGHLGEDEAKAFGRALAKLPEPVLAYCRTGTRSTTLWALAMSASLPVAEITRTAAAAGYDVTGALSAHGHLE